MKFWAVTILVCVLIFVAVRLQRCSDHEEAQPMAPFTRAELEQRIVQFNAAAQAAGRPEMPTTLPVQQDSDKSFQDF